MPAARKERPLIVYDRTILSSSPTLSILLRCCPPNSYGKRSVTVLCDRLGITYAPAYTWIRNGKIPADRIPSLMKLSREAAPDDPVKFSDFEPFLSASRQGSLGRKKVESFDADVNELL